MGKEINIEQAVNARLKILHLKQRIAGLQRFINQNITVSNAENPQWVEVDLNKIDAEIIINNGCHVLNYKDITIVLHTGGGVYRPSQRVFRDVMGKQIGYDY